jgi:hypothetical protein
MKSEANPTRREYWLQVAVTVAAVVLTFYILRYS